MQPSGPAPPAGVGSNIPRQGIALDSAAPIPLDDNAEMTSQIKLYEHKQHQRQLVRLSLLGVIAVALVACIALFLIYRHPAQASLQLGNFPSTHLTLPSLPSVPLSTSEQYLEVNRQLQANGSIVLAPTITPSNPVLGQIYLDNTTKQLLYYNGKHFISLGGTVTNNTFVTNQGDTVINNYIGGSVNAVLLQGSTPGVTQSGNFTISGAGVVRSLTASDIVQANTVNATARIQAPVVDTATAIALHVGGTNATAIDLDNDTAITGGLTVDDDMLSINPTTGNVAVNTTGNGHISLQTGTGAGVTGGITISTGDSTTTASGDINIDTGVGIVDGEVIENKGFEDGVDAMQNWFSTSVTTTTEQAHSGSQSLKVTTTDAGGFYGIQTNLNASGFAKPVPGHTYYFSYWVRAGTTPHNISTSVQMGSNTIALTAQTDTTTQWTQITGLGQAAADATQFYFTIRFGGANGEVHYFDDMQITDMSSASAMSSISIGATNAKLLTIGNMNEIGATTINGSSGITLNSGNGSIQENGGVINLNANAASSFTASRGSLTLTGAASSSWGLIQAASGAGGNLTLHAGKGGAETNNSGGNLILQGGAANGIGAGGSVIVKPATNSTAAFQIQNAAGTVLFVADSSGMQITINGNLTVHGTLTTNGHIITGNSTSTTTVAAGSVCSASAVSLDTGSNDTAGTVTVTIDTGCSPATGDLVDVTYGSAYNAAARIALTPGNPNAAGLQYYRDSSTTGFSIETGTPIAPGATYTFDYQVMQ